uniref:Uncharacterized protein n=1 Tax=Leersia perrieri TaxID=77586 RepID=A0A0D9WAN3_9ORYZ
MRPRHRVISAVRSSYDLSTGVLLFSPRLSSPHHPRNRKRRPSRRILEKRNLVVRTVATKFFSLLPAAEGCTAQAPASARCLGPPGTLHLATGLLGAGIHIHRPSPTPPPPLHLNYPRSYTFPDPFHWRLKWGSPASVVLLIPWRRNRGQCRMVLNRELGASGGAPSSIPITLPFLSTISAGSITQDQTTQNLPASNFQKEFSYDVTRFSLSNENLPPRNSAS